MNQPLEPMKSLPVPKANEKPIAQNIRKLIDRLMRIFPITAPAFFMRERPTSSMAKPACMNRTRTAAKNTRRVLIAMSGVADVLSGGQGRDEQQHQRRKHRHQPE